MMADTDIQNGQAPAAAQLPVNPTPAAAPSKPAAATPAAATPPKPGAAPLKLAAVGPAPSAVQSEGSWLGRFVALFTPVLAVFAGWVAGWVAKEVPGAHLSPTDVTTFMVATLTAVLAAGLHWLHGWQQHERLVVENNATPVVTARSHLPLIPRPKAGQ